MHTSALQCFLSFRHPQEQNKTIEQLFIRQISPPDDQLQPTGPTTLASLFDLPDELREQKRLKVLSVHGYLSTVPSWIGDLTELRYLNLNYCSLITALPETIGNLSKLAELHLAYMRLTALPESVGNLHALTSLDLTCNSDILSLPSTIGNLSNLRCSN